MAAATDSTPALARRLLRAAGRVLTTADVLALVADAPPIVLAPLVDPDCLDGSPPHAAERHSSVLRQHNAGGRPRTSKSVVANFGQRRHGRFSRSVLPTPVRLRS